MNRRPFAPDRRSTPNVSSRLAELVYWPDPLLHQYDARLRELVEAGTDRSTAALKAFKEVGAKLGKVPA